MNDRINYLVLKSERGLAAARSHVVSEDYDFAVSRAYYAMFYMAEAILLTKGLSASKHSGLLSMFGEHFVKPGFVPQSFHHDLHRAFDMRQKGDYWSEPIVSKEAAEDLCRTAEVFIGTLRKLLER